MENNEFSEEEYKKAVKKGKIYLFFGLLIMAVTILAYFACYFLSGKQIEVLIDAAENWWYKSFMLLGMIFALYGTLDIRIAKMKRDRKGWWSNGSY